MTLLKKIEYFFFPCMKKIDSGIDDVNSHVDNLCLLLEYRKNRR